ncbi:uncharacterized protein ASPGLDRAFT_44366, partial [Aspergillus glaucus CBS 516.65]
GDFKTRPNAKNRDHLFAISEPTTEYKHCYHQSYVRCQYGGSPGNPRDPDRFPPGAHHPEVTAQTTQTRDTGKSYTGPSYAQELAARLGYAPCIPILQSPPKPIRLGAPKPYHSGSGFTHSTSKDYRR